jgi:hypothetical protein
MNATPRRLLLSAALTALLAAGAPAFAQDATGDAAIVAESTMSADRLADRYADLAGSPEAATTLINELRTGGDFTVTETVTTPVVDAQGNPVLDANGNPQTTTSTVERTIVNPNGPMGYGEVNISLSLAQALLDSGAYTDLQSALTGVETTVTNPDGTTTTTTSGGVLAMRASGMGWGEIAHQLDLNLGTLMSAANSNANAKANANAKVDAKANANAKANAKVGTTDRTDRRGGAERAPKPERAERAERPERADRPERPERAERPDRPDRPERPERPERSGRP